MFIPWRQIEGILVAAISRDEAFKFLNSAFSSRRETKVAFCNAHLANIARMDSAVQEALSDFLVLPDGIGVDIYSRLLHGSRFPENLNGTDFIPALLRAAQTPLHVALLGARPGVAARAAVKMTEIAPAHTYEVVYHGYFGAIEDTGVLQRLRELRPDLLLVAFGSPRQELWIAQHAGDQLWTVAAGVGALFDFLGGEVPRAPIWLRRTRLEWTYRLYCEPSRLWRRYLLGNARFLTNVFARKLTRIVHERSGGSKR